MNKTTFFTIAALLLLNSHGKLAAQTSESPSATATKWERIKNKQNAGLFHFELEWREDLFLADRNSSKYGHRTLKRSDYGSAPKGHSLQANFLFNLPTRASRESGVGQWTAGAGIGLHNVAGYNSLPVFLTLRYRPFLSQVPSLFAYADMGCSVTGKQRIVEGENDGSGVEIDGKYYRVEGNEFNFGPFGALGVGYQHMFKRHFGLSVKLGFHLQQFRRQVGYKVELIPVPHQDDEDGVPGNFSIMKFTDVFYCKSLISSLQLGVGLVF